jgi:hypothetical protein
VVQGKNLTCLWGNGPIFKKMLKNWATMVWIISAAILSFQTP